MNSYPGEARLERLIFILIGAFGDREFERLEFHAAAMRYAAECEKLGLQDVDFMFDFVHETSRVVDEAMFDAVAYHFVRCTDRRADRYANNMSERALYRLITKLDDMPEAEVELAKKAAQITIEAIRDGKVRHKYKSFRPVKEEHEGTASD